MRIVSINVGRPREVPYRNQTVATSIFKSPVSGRVRVGRLNVEGDEQSDLSVHGGVDKAVYAYPSEHYAYWREALPDLEFPWGAFGENLTMEGLFEDDTYVGDTLQIGTAEFCATQPRMPCFKLGLRFDRPDMVKRFLASRRTGFYLSVLREGEIGADDAVTRTARGDGGMTVADIAELYTASPGDPELLKRASELAALPESWREHFRKRLPAQGA
jgi:MOSC domain-containing protein YiiM